MYYYKYIDCVQQNKIFNEQSCEQSFVIELNMYIFILDSHHLFRKHLY